MANVSSQASPPKIRIRTVVSLVALLATVAVTLVALLTPGWLHLRAACTQLDGNLEESGIDVGLLRVCFQDKGCRSQPAGPDGSIRELANHILGQTVQDKVAIATLSASTACDGLAFVLLCVLLCVPKKRLAKAAWVFCGISCFFVFVGCAVWTGFVLFAQIAGIWADPAPLEPLLAGNGTNCTFALFGRYQWGDMFPLQYSFFLAWVAFLLAAVDAGLAEGIVKKFRQRGGGATFTVVNQTNVNNDVNVGGQGGAQLQSPAVPKQNMSPNQILINPGDVNMSQNLDSSQVNNQQTANPNQVVLHPNHFSSVRSGIESVDSDGYMKVNNGLQ